MLKPVTVVEQMVDTLPGWAYPVMLMFAFILSLAVAGMGYRMMMAVLKRAVRSPS